MARPRLELAEVLKDPFAAFRGARAAGWLVDTDPLNKDGAEHQRWRTLMTRTFTPRRVEQIR